LPALQETTMTNQAQNRHIDNVMSVAMHGTAAA
jgi:hypothetical protein